MGDFGVKVSQRGYGVDTKDFKLLYSSAWPLLTILEQGSFSNKAPGSTLVAHNLGYNPMFLIFHDHQNSTDYSNGIGAAGQVHMIDGFNANVFGINDSVLGYASTATGSRSGYYFIFQVDLEDDYTAPNVNTGTISDSPDSQDKDYGIKASKDGEDVSSTDLRDFALHSATRSPMVDSVTTGTKAAGSTPITINHSLGYAPWPLSYAKLTSGAFSPSRYQMLTTASDSFVTSDATNVNTTIPYACDYSIVILKDPLKRD